MSAWPAMNEPLSELRETYSGADGVAVRLRVPAKLAWFQFVPATPFASLMKKARAELPAITAPDPPASVPGVMAPVPLFTLTGPRRPPPFKLSWPAKEAEPVRDAPEKGVVGVLLPTVTGPVPRAEPLVLVRESVPAVVMVVPPL